jgi:iron complex outermembrane receptor protein
MKSTSIILTTLGSAVLVCGFSYDAVAVEADPADSAGGIDEIIITAERRKENILDVPSTVQAFSAAALDNQGIDSTRDLMQVVPGLNFAIKGIFAQPVLRGISTQGTAVDSAVAMYIDGVYQASTSAVLFDLGDIDSVEVLKGPQGTLYGRNAEGGAILLKSRQPSFTPGGDISVSYGSYNERQFNTFLTAPLIDDFLAGSVSAFYKARDGYVHDLLRGGSVGDLESYAFRGSLLAKFAPDVEFTLTGYHGFLSDPTVYAGIAAGGNSLSRRVAPTLPVATRAWDSTTNLYPYNKGQSTGITLNGTIGLGWGELTTTTGYTSTVSDAHQDADQGPAPALGIISSYPSVTRSQEVSVATQKFGQVSFIFGAMYFGQDQASQILVNNATSVAGKQQISAYAAYGEAQWDITERLRGIAGARFSGEQRDYQGFAGGAGPGLPTNERAEGSHHWDATTPRVSLDYKLSDNTHAYATYNKAFKSGTYNPTGLLSTPVDPETTIAYEVGLKTAYSVFNLDVAAFHYKFENLQVSATLTTPTGTASVLQNAAAAEISGVEIEGSVHLTQALKLSGGFSYLDDKYTDFPKANVNTPYPTCPGPSPCGNFANTIDATGFPMARTPRYTGNLTAEYLTTLFRGDFRASLAAYYNSGFSWEVANRLRQGTYTTLNANLAWRPPGSKLEYSIWGRNLTDRVYEIQSADSAGGDAVSFAEPRAAGIKIQLKF